MDQMKIVLYAKDRCPYCRRTKRLLRRRGYAFEVVDLGRDDGLRAWRAHLARRKAVPYLFIDHRPVGGFHAIKALDRSGDLDRLVRGEV